jgi:hypothetical protein
MRERATTSRSVDEVYEAARRQMKRFGTDKISSRLMNGRQIWFPTDWDGAARRTGREEREQRLAELRRSLRRSL